MIIFNDSITVSFTSAAFKICLGRWQMSRPLPRHIYVSLVFVPAKKAKNKKNKNKTKHAKAIKFLGILKKIRLQE